MQLSDATVLVVDDRRSHLRNHGRMVCAPRAPGIKRRQGQEALKLLTESHVDVIISDVRMPVMDEVARVRAIAITGAERPLVILVTGFSDLQQRDDYALGVEAIIEKPLERDQLISEVKRGLTDRNELWGKPAESLAEDVLAASPVCLVKFSSFADALRDGQIAFGRGGFCLKTPHKFREGRVQFRLEFQADQKIVSGAGIVRWGSPAGNLLGIEVLYIDDQCRRWIADLGSEAASTEAVQVQTALIMVPIDQRIFGRVRIKSELHCSTSSGTNCTVHFRTRSFENGQL